MLKDIGHRARTLLVPYFILSLVYFILTDTWNLFTKQPINSLTLKNIIGLFIQIPYKYESAFWFFGALFFASTILLILIYVFKENEENVFIASLSLTVVGVIITDVLKLRLVWNLDIVLTIMIFIAFGYFVKKKSILEKFDKINKKNKIKYVVIFAVLGVLISYLNFRISNTRIDYYRRFQTEPISRYISGIINIIFIVLICKTVHYDKKMKIKNRELKLNGIKSIERIGRNSEMYYVFSAIAINVEYYYVDILESSYGVINNIYIACIVCVLCAIIIPIPIIILLRNVSRKTLKNNGKENNI